MRTGVATAAIAGTYFVLIRFIIMPSFGTWYFADHYHAITPAKDRSFGGVIKTMLSNPCFVAASLLTWEKLRYAFQVLAPITSLRDGLYDAPRLLYDQAAHGHDVGDKAQRQNLYEVVELRSPLKLLRRVKPAP